MKKSTKNPSKAKKTVKAEGEKSRPRLDKFARGGAAKKDKTIVNVIVGSPKEQAPPMPMGAAPPPMMPPPRPPGLKTGGVAKMTAGAGGGKGRLEKIDTYKKK